MVVGIEVKKCPEEMKSQVQSSGIIDGGLKLVKEAFARKHKFSVGRNVIKVLSVDTEGLKPTIFLGHHIYNISRGSH
jgi:hypothetical protein